MGLYKFLVIVLVFTLLGCGKRADVPTENPYSGRARILYSGLLMGRLHPQGCAIDQLGGLARRATIVDRVKREMPGDVILLDVGDNLFDMSSKQLNEDELSQAKRVASVLGKMDYDAILPGELDARMGLQKLLGETSLPWLGVHLKKVKKTIDEVRSIRLKGGMLVAVIGLAFIETKEAGLAARLEEHFAKAKQLVDNARGNHDIIVALSNLGYDNDVQLASRVEAIDLIVGGRSGSLLDEPTVVGNTLIVQPGRYGQYLGDLTLSFNQKHRMWFNATPYFMALEEYGLVYQELETLEKNPQADVKIVDRLRGEKARLKAAIEKLPKPGEKDGESFYISRLVPLTEGIEGNANIKEMLRE